ncbi:MAG: hypothetical protein QM702_21635 [Rubrivivax sp.]
MDLPALLPSAIALLPALAMLAVALLAPRADATAAWRRWHWASGTALAAALSSLGLQLAGVATASLPGLTVTLTGAWVALLVQALATVIGGFSSRHLEGEAGQPRFAAALGGVLAAVHLLLLAGHWLVLIAAWAAVGVVLRARLSECRTAHPTVEDRDPGEHLLGHPAGRARSEEEDVRTATSRLEETRLHPRALPSELLGDHEIAGALLPRQRGGLRLVAEAARVDLQVQRDDARDRDEEHREERTQIRLHVRDVLHRRRLVARARGALRRSRPAGLFLLLFQDALACLHRQNWK